MIESPQPAPKASGLQTVLNVISAPKEAFETLREAPTWGWALIITFVLVAIGTFLMLPAMHHAQDLSWPQTVASNPSLSGMSEVKLAQAKQFGDMFITFSPIFILIGLSIGMLIQTLIMFLFDKIGRGSGTFKSFWASAWNVAAVSAGIGSIIVAIIVLIRGADSFDTQASVQGAMPSLALLAPHAGKLTNFLGVFTPFTLWGGWLIAQAMIYVARTSRGIAWTTGIISVVFPALFAMLGPGAK